MMSWPEGAGLKQSPVWGGKIVSPILLAVSMKAGKKPATRDSSDISTAVAKFSSAHSPTGPGQDESWS